MNKAMTSVHTSTQSNVNVNLTFHVFHNNNISLEFKVLYSVQGQTPFIAYIVTVAYGIPTSSKSIHHLIHRLYYRRLSVPEREDSYSIQFIPFHF